MDGWTDVKLELLREGGGWRDGGWVGGREGRNEEWIGWWVGEEAENERNTRVLMQSSRFFPPQQPPLRETEGKLRANGFEN